MADTDLDISKLIETEYKVIENAQKLALRTNPSSGQEGYARAILLHSQALESLLRVRAAG